MGGSLTEQRRVSDEVFRNVKLCCAGRMEREDPLVTVPREEATANYVPAAAVIRRGQALSGFTGCKGGADGLASLK